MATVETPAGLGSALRAARTAKSLSLSDVAAATGISPSFLSLVENGKSDITIGRLVRLVTFYGIHLGDLVAVKPAPSRTSCASRSSGRSRRRRGDKFRLLAPSVQGVMMPMIVEFEPSAHLAEYGRHAGEEFVHVLRGSMALELEGSEPRILRAGDSAYYSAERPHLFRNASDTQPLRIICVDSPPNL